mgnify:CR=1 FL=1
MNMFKFFQHRKYKRMVKKGSTFVLTDLLGIINEMIERLREEGRIKSPLHETILKMESTALVFWLLRWDAVFPEPIQRMTLDEVHQQYFSNLKKHAGMDSQEVQNICDELNHIYKTYDGFMYSSEDFAKIGTEFAKSVSVGAKTELDATEMTIPIELMDRTRSKFDEYREVMK